MKVAAAPSTSAAETVRPDEVEVERAQVLFRRGRDLGDGVDGRAIVADVERQVVVTHVVAAVAGAGGDGIGEVDAARRRVRDGCRARGRGGRPFRRRRHGRALRDRGSFAQPVHRMDIVSVATSPTTSGASGSGHGPRLGGDLFFRVVSEVTRG